MRSAGGHEIRPACSRHATDEVDDRLLRSAVVPRGKRVSLCGWRAGRSGRWIRRRGLRRSAAAGRDEQKRYTHVRFDHVGHHRPFHSMASATGHVGAMASSLVKVLGFCIAGKSLKVSANCAPAHRESPRHVAATRRHHRTGHCQQSPAVRPRRLPSNARHFCRMTRIKARMPRLATTDATAIEVERGSGPYWCTVRPVPSFPLGAGSWRERASPRRGRSSRARTRGVRTGDARTQSAPCRAVPWKNL